MICPNCGTDVPETNKFCTKCGTKVNEIINNNNTEPETGFNQTIMRNNQQPVVQQVSQTVQPSMQESIQPTQYVQTQQANQPKQKININEIKKIIIEKISKNKKLSIIIGSSLLAFIILLIIILIAGNSKKEFESLKYIYDPKKPIIIEKNNKYGYINTSGKEIVSPNFDSASEFYDGYGVLSNEIDDDLDKNYTIVNAKGKIIKQVTEYLEPIYKPEYNLWVLNDGIYNKKFKKISKENVVTTYIGCGYSSYDIYTTNEFGIINNKGKKIFSWNGTDSVASINETSCNTQDKYAIVRHYETSENEIIVYLKNGKTIDSIDGKDSSYTDLGQGLFKEYNKNSGETIRYLYFNKGKLLYETTDKIYDIDVYDKDKNLLLIDYGYSYESKEKSEQYMIYNAAKKTYEKYDEKSYDLIEKYYGFKTFESSSKQGLIKDNKIILNAEYDRIKLLDLNLYNYLKEYQNKQYILLEKDDKTMIYDVKKSKTIAEFDAQMETDESTTFLVGYTNSSNNSKSYIVYNLITNKSQEFDYKTTDEIKKYTNYITVKHDNVVDYYNTKLKKIYTKES